MNENKETSHDLLPIESGADTQTDDQLVLNIEENKNLVHDDGNMNVDTFSLIKCLMFSLYLKEIMI